MDHPCGASDFAPAGYRDPLPTADHHPRSDRRLAEYPPAVGIRPAAAIALVTSDYSGGWGIPDHSSTRWSATARVSPWAASPSTTRWNKAVSEGFSCPDARSRSSQLGSRRHRAATAA